jgi:hypothetical protein
VVHTLGFQTSSEEVEYRPAAKTLAATGCHAHCSNGSLRRAVFSIVVMSISGSGWMVSQTHPKLSQERRGQLAKIPGLIDEFIDGAISLF